MEAPSGGRLPVLLPHGGPGFPSDPFESLEALGAVRAPGGPLRPERLRMLGQAHDPSWWTKETFVDELGAVRRELGLDRVHRLGWSWGGILAHEYLLTSRTGS